MTSTMNSAARKIDTTAPVADSGLAGSALSQSAVRVFASSVPAVMPWESGLEEDRRFKKWALHGLGVCAMLVVLTSLLPQQPASISAGSDNREQYAKLVIEEKFVPPPPVEVPEPKPEPVQKQIEKPKPVAKPEPKPLIKEKPPEVKAKPKVNEAQQRAAARERAANAGLLAMSDQLASMRQKASTQSVSNLSSEGNKAAAVKRKVIATKTNNQLSGAAAVSQQSAGVNLAERSAAAVVVSEAAVAAVESSAASSTYQSSRSADEVRRVMDANKGGIYSVYNRALRKNPILQGTFGFTLTIEPSGAISSVVMTKSELADPALEKRLLARIRLIKFEPADVGVTEVNYSFDFLPS